jgi:hypothetical protein
VLLLLLLSLPPLLLLLLLLVPLQEACRALHCSSRRSWPAAMGGPSGHLKSPIYTVIPVTPPGAGWWHLLPPSCQLLAPTAINPAYSG